jgi:phosphate transport system permease protein
VTTTDLPVRESVAPRPLAKKRGRPGDALFHAAVLGAISIALGFLIWLLVAVLVDGLPQLDWQFLTAKTSTSPERTGFNSAMRGTLLLMVVTAVVALPLGFAAAIYLEKIANLTRDQLLSAAGRRERHLNERAAAGDTGPAMFLGRLRLRLSYVWARIGPPINTLVEVNISNLAAVPSIIYGLLGLAAFVGIMGLQKSLLVGGLTLAILILPIIIIASREALRAVPVSIEQGAIALGASRWQAISRQVVPAAFPGMLTGAILAMSRAIGETAPLVVIGAAVYASKTISLNPLNAGQDPLVAMPLQVYAWTANPRSEFISLAAAGIIVLLASLVLMNLFAIIVRNRYTRNW